MNKRPMTLTEALTVIVGGLPVVFILVGGFTYWVVRTFVTTGKS